MIFSDLQKIGFSGILGPPYCGIGATIRIGREMLCLPYAGFFVQWIDLGSKNPLQLAHSGYQDTKIFGTKVWGGSLDFNIAGRQINLNTISGIKNSPRC